MENEHDMRLVVVVDTREQLPYTFEENEFSVIRAKLEAGDYSVEGFEGRVAVERKTLDDFVNSVVHGRKRFFKEIERLAEYAFACVVVEAGIAEVLRGEYVSAAHPNSILGSSVAITVDFGVPVFFCSNREVARLFTEMYLLRVYRKLNRHEKEDK